MSEESNQLSDEAIVVMLAYSSDLKEHQGSFGESVNELGHFPYMNKDEIIGRFIDRVYADGWAMPFDWTEQGDLLADDMYIAQASIEEIRKAFTYAVRSDRFCDGNLVTLFSVGVIQKLLNRLEIIHQS